MQLFISVLLSLMGLFLIATIFLSLQKVLKISKQKITLIIILFVIGFLIYFIGYYDSDKPIEALAMALMSATQMIVLNNNLEGMTNPIVRDQPWLLLILSLISVFIFGIIAQTLIVTLFKDFRTKMTYKYSRVASYFLVYGYQREVDGLIQEIQSCDQDKDQDNPPNLLLLIDRDRELLSKYKKEKVLNCLIKEIYPDHVVVTFKEHKIIVKRCDVIDYDLDYLMSMNQEVFNKRTHPISIMLTDYHVDGWIGSNLKALMKSRKVFVIDDIMHREEIIQKGFLFISNHKELPTPKHKKHIYVFLMDSDEVKNAAVFQSMMDDKKSNDNYYIRIQSEMIKENITSNYNKVNLHFIDDTQLIINALFKRYPIENTLDIDPHQVNVKSPFNVFIGGINHIGMSLFKTFVMQGQFVDHPPRVDLHDLDIEKVKGTFYTQMPAIEQCCQLNFLSAQVVSEIYYKQMVEGLPYHYICFCYEDDLLNIELAKNFFRRMKHEGIQKKPHVFCYVKNDVYTSYFKTLELDSHIILFGQQNQLYHLNDILQDRIDQHAKLYFYAYETFKKSQDPKYVKEYYHDVNYFTRDSNRQVLNHFPIKLKLISHTQTSFVEEITSVEDFKMYLNQLNKDALLRLSELEHLRWNAFHYVHGWSNMSKEIAIQRLEAKKKGTLPLGEKPTKDFIARKHVCLVNFNDLEPLEVLFNEPYRMYDTNNVLNMVEIMKMI